MLSKLFQQKNALISSECLWLRVVSCRASLKPRKTGWRRGRGAEAAQKDDSGRGKLYANTHFDNKK